MFQNWGSDQKDAGSNGNEEMSAEVALAEPEAEVKSDNKEQEVSPPVDTNKSNAVLKGSKLMGDITITNDLELSGDVEGSITSAKDSNIMLKGTCKGNIDTKGGSVYIEGSLESGSISAGKEVIITGKFNGEGVKAGEKIYVNGEFNGRLEAKDIEIGPDAVGKGEIYYTEFVSVAKGAKVDVQIGQSQPGLKIVNPPQSNKIDMSMPFKEEIKEENKEEIKYEDVDENIDVNIDVKKEARKEARKAKRQRDSSLKRSKETTYNLN